MSCESSFSKLFVTSPTSQLILQHFRRFTYVTVHSPTLPLLHLCHSSFSNPSFAYPTSQVLHLASRPWNDFFPRSDRSRHSNQIFYLQHLVTPTSYFSTKSTLRHRHISKLGTHGRLAWWRACDVGEAKEGLENELWRRWSNGSVGEWTVT